MELRENAGGDKNLFSVERKMRKQQQKLEQQREKQYQREKEREENNIFNFINATLGDKRMFKKNCPIFFKLYSNYFIKFLNNYFHLQLKMKYKKIFQKVKIISRQNPIDN